MTASKPEPSTGTVLPTVEGNPSMKSANALNWLGAAPHATQWRRRCTGMCRGARTLFGSEMIHMLPRDIESEPDIVLTLHPGGVRVVLELIIVPEIRRRAARITECFISRDAKLRYAAFENIRTVSTRQLQYVETDVLSILNRMSTSGPYVRSRYCRPAGTWGSQRNSRQSSY